MKAIVRITVNKFETPTTPDNVMFNYSTPDYNVLVANIKGKGMSDIHRKVDLLVHQIEKEEGAEAMGSTILWNKEFNGLGFIKHSKKNGFTGHWSKCKADLQMFSTLSRA